MTSESYTIDNLNNSIKSQQDFISQLTQQLRNDSKTIDALSVSLKAEQVNYLQLRDQLKQHLMSDALIIDNLSNSVKTEQLTNAQLKQQLKRQTTSDKLFGSIKQPRSTSPLSIMNAASMNSQSMSDQLTINTLQNTLNSEQNMTLQLRQQLTSYPITIDTLSISLKYEQSINAQLRQQLISFPTTIDTLSVSLKSEQNVNKQLSQQLTSNASTIYTLRNALKTEKVTNAHMVEQSTTNPTIIDDLRNTVKNNQHIITKLTDKITSTSTSSTETIDKLKQSLIEEKSKHAKLLATINYSPLNHYTTNLHKIINTKGGGIFGELHKKNLKKIRHVYQTEYVNDIAPTGLGDFIRGCYFVLHFCEDYNFEPEFYINHPINSFTQHEPIEGINKSSVYNISKLNNCVSGILDPTNYVISYVQHQSDIHEFLEIVNTLPIDNGCINLFTILFPYRDILERDKVIMKKLLMPNDQMDDILNNTLRCVKLTKQMYSVIHIRLGDDYLINNETDVTPEKIAQLSAEISNIIATNKDELLLLCDNNTIKRLMCNKFTQLKDVGFKINHFGENVVQTQDTVKNNLTDFYLMANSNAIHAFSCYNHGTGFSRWCATTYDIPYSCKFIGQNNIGQNNIGQNTVID